MSSLRAFIFRIRSYTPLPFLLVMVVFARPTLESLVGGFVIVLAGEAIRFWGVSIAGAETRTTGTVGGTYLITNGPFAYIRNPLYAGNILLYTGIGVMSMALFPWLLVIAFVWFVFQYVLIVLGEEEYLLKRFGDEYAAYTKHVRRFLPRMTPYRTGAPPAKTVSLEEGLASEKRTLQAIVLVSALIVAIYLFR